MSPRAQIRAEIEFHGGTGHRETLTLGRPPQLAELPAVHRCSAHVRRSPSRRRTRSTPPTPIMRHPGGPCPRGPAPAPRTASTPRDPAWLEALAEDSPRNHRHRRDRNRVRELRGGAREPAATRARAGKSTVAVGPPRR